MTQPDLFDVGPRTLPKRGCTPAAIGSGPQGETCRSCAHYTRVEYHNRVYLKCGLVQPHWTHGPGSDIRASWPACRSWTAPTP